MVLNHNTGRHTTKEEVNERFPFSIGSKQSAKMHCRFPCTNQNAPLALLTRMRLYKFSAHSISMNRPDMAITGPCVNETRVFKYLMVLRGRDL